MRRLLIIICLSLLVTSQALAVTTLSRLLGTEATWASGSSLGSNSEVLGAVITYANAGYPFAWCNFSVTYSGTPTAGSAALVWFRVSTDGTNYPSVPIAEPPHMVFPFVAGASPQLVSPYVANVPASTTVKLYVRNDGTGLTFTTWSVKCKQETIQSN